MSKNIYIPGIYNYCNSWCERCSFTHRCQIYLPTPSQSDDDKASILETLHDSLQEAMDILRVSVESKGLDWEAFQREAANAIPEPEERSSEQERLVVIAEDYSKAARNWLDQHEKDLRARGQELSQQIQMGLDVRDKGLALADALEVIQWYVFFIKAKTQRAIHSANIMDADECDTIQNDANGSAKVALVAIDSTMAAWQVVLNRFPDLTNSIIDILLLLNRLKIGLEAHFSNARAFIRPGFDQVV